MPSSARTVMKRIPRQDLVALDKVRLRLGLIWMGGGGLILVIVALQSLLGYFGDKQQEAWAWLLPCILPTLGMIAAALGLTALDPVYSGFVVRKSYFQLAFWLSAFYLALVLLTIVIQPATGESPIELMRTSNLWLGPCQGLVASALGVLFVSKQQAARNRDSERI